MTEPTMVFPASANEIRINFGVYAGREVTAAEIEDLARELRTRVAQFSIIAEQHFEFGEDAEAVVHLVRVEVPQADDELRGRLLEIIERWADACVAERHVEVAEL
jgi:hypothetical protein